jgi:isocitrate lyase
MHLNGYGLKYDWENDSRWSGIQRDWTPEDVIRLRGSFLEEHTLAEITADKLWDMLTENEDEAVRSLGASTPAQAVQMAQAGLKAIYVSGWQVAADVNGDMYPDQSLYPADCVPKLVRAINNALSRQDQIDVSSSKDGLPETDWLVPCIADAEAGFGGKLNAFELMKAMIRAGAAGVHFEDQLSSEKKCGHLGGKVLVPVQEMINKLKAARLAADICGTNTVLIARTDANSAKLLTSDSDHRDLSFLKFENETAKEIYEPTRTQEGFYNITGGIEMAISRGLAYAPYADLLWCETSTPSIEEARRFAEGIHAKFPGKMLAYNCSPSFNWSKNLSLKEIATFQDELFKMGYKWLFITLAGFHNLNHSMYNLATRYKTEHMPAFTDMQDEELEDSKAKHRPFMAIKHQAFVGTGYFDEVSKTINKDSSTTALDESTEAEQF